MNFTIPRLYQIPYWSLGVVGPTFVRTNTSVMTALNAYTFLRYPSKVYIRDRPGSDPIVHIWSMYRGIPVDVVDKTLPISRFIDGSTEFLILDDKDNIDDKVNHDIIQLIRDSHKPFSRRPI